MNCKKLRRKKLGPTMNTEFSDQRKCSAWKTASNSTRTVSSMPQREKEWGHGKHWARADPPPFDPFSTAPLWFVGPRAGVAAGAPAGPHSQQPRLWCWCLLHPRGLCWLMWQLLSKLTPQQKEPGEGTLLGTLWLLRTTLGGWHCCWVCWQDILVAVQSIMKDTIFFYFKSRDWIRWLLGLFQP